MLQLTTLFNYKMKKRLKKYEFTPRDLLNFRYILLKVYNLTLCSEHKSVIGYKLNLHGWKSSEVCFIFSEGDQGYSNAVTFWFNSNEEPKTMSFYQFILEYLLTDILLKTYNITSLTPEIQKIKNNMICIIVNGKDDFNIIKSIKIFYDANKKEIPVSTSNFD